MFEMHGKSLSAQYTHFVISEFLQFQNVKLQKSLAGKHLLVVNHMC